MDVNQFGELLTVGASATLQGRVETIHVHLHVTGSIYQARQWKVLKRMLHGEGDGTAEEKKKKKASCGGSSCKISHLVNMYPSHNALPACKTPSVNGLAGKAWPSLAISLGRTIALRVMGFSRDLKPT